MNWRSSIVERSGSLTAHICSVSEKVCTFSTLAILRKLYFCNWVQAVFSTCCTCSNAPNGDGIGYRKSTKIVYFGGCIKQVPIRSEIDNKLTTAVVKSYIWKREFTKDYSNATSENGYNARL